MQKSSKWLVIGGILAWAIMIGSCALVEPTQGRTVPSQAVSAK